MDFWKIPINTDNQRIHALPSPIGENFESMDFFLEVRTFDLIIIAGYISTI